MKKFGGPHHCPSTGGDCFNGDCDDGCQRMPKGGDGQPPQKSQECSRGGELREQVTHDRAAMQRM